MIERELISTFNLQDIILLPLLVFLLYRYYKKTVIAKLKQNDRLLVQMFVGAFFFKLICTVFHAAINEFYYLKAVDSFTYYMDTLKIKSYLMSNSNASLWDVYFDREAFTEKTGMSFSMLGTEVTANVPLVALPLSIVFFNSYLCISFFVGFFALKAAHKLYVVFIDTFPGSERQAAIATVILPGVCFWSSILLKDTFSFIGLGYSFYYFWKIFIKGEKRLFYFFMLLLSIYIIFSFKPYVLLILLSYFLWFAFRIFQKMKNFFLKFTAFIFLAAIGSATVFLVLNQLNSTSTGPLASYKTDAITGQIEALQNSYTLVEEGDSRFSLGEINFLSPASVLAAVPRALAAIFLRPYIWEARKPIMLLSAIESAFILFLFLYTLFKTKIFGFFGMIFRDPFLGSFFIFCILFGTIVAFATPNFGTLVRYKIPAMPFVIFILLVMRNKIKMAAKIKAAAQKNTVITVSV